MLLENLSELIDQCRNEYDNLSYKSDIQLNTELKRLLVESLKNVDSSSTHEIHTFSIEFITREGLTTSVPSSGLWYGYVFWKLRAALKIYCEYLNQLKTKLRDEHGIPHATEFLKKLPSQTLYDDDDPIAEKFLELIDSQFNDRSDRELFKSFCGDKSWWFKSNRGNHKAPSGKTLDRGDVGESSLMLACGVVIANSAKLAKIIDAFEQNSNLRNYFASQNFHEFDFSDNNNHPSPSVSQNRNPGENIIYYGAPGTGKSHKIDTLCTSTNSIRTVFHEGFQYGDFVVSLKPRMNGGNIEYSFRPGPFCMALKLVEQNPDIPVYLVIEEINRASAAAIFGDIFQLLDRLPSGRSKYDISVYDTDMLDYLKDNAPSSLVGDRLHLSSNLNLYATMNSSDQAVMPLDTAFKRRWKFEYVPLDFSGQNMATASEIQIGFNDGSTLPISWKDFALTINDVLSKRGIPEDRLLGPWFLSESDIGDTSTFAQSLKSKVMLYLWSDVMQHYDKGILFSSNVKTFGELVVAFDGGAPVFSGDVESTFKSRVSGA